MTERIDPCAASAFAAYGLAAHMEAAGWRVAGRIRREGALWYVPLERDGQEPVAQAVRPVAEQAAAMGLRRVAGAADVIWSGMLRCQGEGNDADAGHTR